MNRCYCGKVAVMGKHIAVTKGIDKPGMLIIGMHMKMNHHEPTNSNYSVMIHHILPMLQPRVIDTKLQANLKCRA